MTKTYHITIANLVSVRAAGVSYQMTIVPADSPGGSTRPLRYLLESELRDALYNLGLRPNLVEAAIAGANRDGFFFQPGVDLNDEQRKRLGLADAA